MAAANDIDLAIIGGGCAGLSLARMLAVLRGSARTLVLEPRTDYTDDRTWCFWQPDQHRLRHLVSHSWGKWRFSTTSGAAIQSGDTTMRYQCVRSISFYEEAVGVVSKAQNVNIASGTTVTSIAPFHSGFRIETSAGPVYARYVVDTRPPGHEAISQDGLWQVFTGVEVQTDRDAFEPGIVGLMDDMSTDQYGFRFTYTLPYSRRQALIEETRFTHARVSSAELQQRLGQTLASLPGNVETLRSESGRLPMAVHQTPFDMPAGLVNAGIGGGAIRPSTGYAFLRIQRWAGRCAYRISCGDAPIPHLRDPAWRAAIDGLFLRVLHTQPELGPRLFMAMGKRLSAKTFVRFLSDQCSPTDFARVALVLPKTPFLRRIMSPVALP